MIIDEREIKIKRVEYVEVKRVIFYITFSLYSTKIILIYQF